MERHAIYPVEMIEPLLGPDGPKHIEIDGVKVKKWSDRYAVFFRSKVCTECGCVGTHYASERHVDSQHYHFNLYAQIDGKFRLMTKDHIVPRSKGGRNSLDNYQTMCIKCNMAKGDK